MSAKHAVTLIAFLAAWATGPETARADWSGNPAENLVIADRPDKQELPKVAARSDGGCYIGWLDRASGNYDVYLQRLDPYGNELWPHNGILVSGHPQDTWYTDWDLIVDSDDNALLTFVDLRAGGDWDVYAYRISPAGTFLWGPDGVAVTDNDYAEYDPRIAEMSDGSFVLVCWGEGIGVHKLSRDGVPQFGFTITGQPNESPLNARVVAADSGSCIVSWISDSDYFTGDQHLRAQKYSADGAELWADQVDIFDDDWIPPWYEPILLPDGSGGAIAAWHRSDGYLYSSFVQHLANDGTELFPHNGLELSTLAGRGHMYPRILYDAVADEILAFWQECDGGQTTKGVCGQKISAAGQRMWTDSGSELIPLNYVGKSTPRATVHADGAMVFWFDDAVGSRVVGVRVDGDGALVWPNPPSVFSESPGGKTKLCAAAAGPQDMAVLTWEDDRNPTTDIYAQNANAGGSLGILGDLNSSGCVDLTDLAQLLAYYGRPSGALYWEGDLDGDTDVDLADLAALLANYGAGCP